jgi:hypothetical protein
MPAATACSASAQADPVHLDVVWLTVAAVVVVAGQRVGLFLLQDCGELAGGVVYRRAPERAGVIVGGRAHHPGIDVAEELKPRRAEDPRGGLRLGHPALGQRLAVGQEPLLHLAVLAAGGHHEHHPVSLLVRLAHDAATGDGLVIGMGVEGDQGGHGMTVPG